MSNTLSKGDRGDRKMTIEYRADVVGSLLRPAYLAEAREALEAGRLSNAGFIEIEDRAVDQAIALHEAVGLDVTSDGELRRAAFAEQVWTELEGLAPVEGDEGGYVPFYRGEHGDTPDRVFRFPMCAVERVRRKRTLSLEEYGYARARARLPVKITLPSPLMLFGVWSPTRSTSAYRDIFELFADGVELIRAEAADLARLGCRYIQIDDPALGQLADPRQRESWASMGIDIDRLLTDGVEMVNAVADVPGVTFGLHLCKGNYGSMWIAEGGYESLSKAVFGGATNYDRFLLEYDDVRSGGFEPLADVGDDQAVVLGIVSSKTAELESEDAMLARIREAAHHHPLENIAVSTQCGFSSVGVDDGPNLVDEPAQAAKLRLVARLARRLDAL